MSCEELPMASATIKKLEKSLILYRWISFGLIVLIYFLQQDAKISPVILFAIILFMFFYNLLITLFYTRLFKEIRRYPCLLGLDICICTFMIYTSGGWRSPFYLYALSPLLVAGYIYKTKMVFIWAGILSGLYYLSLLLNGYTLQRVFQMGILNDYILHYASFFFVAFFFTLFFATVEELEESIIAQNLCQTRLLSFYKVFGAISSTLQLKKILSLVVSNTYELTKPKKTVLVLFVEGCDLQIDSDSIVVRDNGRVYSDPDSRAHIERLLPYIAEKEEIVLVTRESLALEGCLIFEDIESVLCVPLICKGNYQGLVISFNPSCGKSEDDLAFLKILGALASTSIENARLIKKKQNLMISEERNRIARDMHDGLAQSLFSLVLNLEVCSRLIESRPEVVKKKLSELGEFASHSLTKTRQYIYDLCPAEICALGLSKALDNYTKEFTCVNGVKANFKATGCQRKLSEDIEKGLYYVAQEALSNARRHAHAKNVDVELSYSDKRITLSVKDDGMGCDIETINRSLTRQKRGISNIKERAGDLGGRCEIVGKKDNGTYVKVEIPL